MNVLKFGGSSIENAANIKRVKKIVTEALSNNQPTLVVASALGGITNQLLEMARRAEQGEEVLPQIKEIENRHLEIIHQLIPVKSQNKVIMQLKFFLNELEELLYGVRAVKELSPKTKDKILSYGELCSTFMLSGILQEDVPSTCFVDTRRLILTDNHFGKAKVLKKETENNIKTYFKTQKAALYCITGFIAADSQGHTTTLGRGGSDYTAALFGAALDAEEIQIWTDVDGFMTADPRIVKRAFSLSEISYTEAKELSYFGAKVIYPPTMTPAITKKIPIRIRNVFNPDFPGTIIHEKTKVTAGTIRGISSIPRVTLVNIQGSGIMGNTGFSERLFGTLSRQGINIVLITQASSEHSITFAISPEDEEMAREALEVEFEMELKAHKLDTPQIVANQSIVAIVGENMKHTTGISGTLFSALGRNGINVVAMAQGSSEYNISVVIDRKDLSKAMNLIHEDFFLSPVKTLNVFYVGIGNIGKTLLQQIKAHEKSLREHNGLHIQMIGLANSRRMLFKSEGFEIADWESLFEKGGKPADLKVFIEKMKALNLPNSVFVDNSASELVVSFYEQILSSNISIVTCNKIGNSGSYQQYQAYREIVKKRGVDFLYETNVGAGLPIIKTLKDLLISGDYIHRIEAILSGSISYIFNEFKDERSFHTIVKEAQEKGFTEPDPRDDLSGMDFMRKMLILARDSGYALELKDITLNPILPEACMKAPDVEAFYKELEKHDQHFETMKLKAASENKVLRFIGKMENGHVSIGLEAVDASHPFYSLSGSDNIITFTTHRYTADCPLVIKGPGAGAEVTAAGVFADLVKVGAQ